MTSTDLGMKEERRNNKQNNPWKKEYRKCGRIDRTSQNRKNNIFKCIKSKKSYLLNVVLSISTEAQGKLLTETKKNCKKEQYML